MDQATGKFEQDKSELKETLASEGIFLAEPTIRDYITKTWVPKPIVKKSKTGRGRTGYWPNCVTHTFRLINWWKTVDKRNNAWIDSKMQALKADAEALFDSLSLPDSSGKAARREKDLVRLHILCFKHEVELTSLRLSAFNQLVEKLGFYDLRARISDGRLTQLANLTHNYLLRELLKTQSKNNDSGLLGLQKLLGSTRLKKLVDSIVP